MNIRKEGEGRMVMAKVLRTDRIVTRGIGAALLTRSLSLLAVVLVLALGSHAYAGSNLESLYAEYFAAKELTMSSYQEFVEVEKRRDALKLRQALRFNSLIWGQAYSNPERFDGKLRESVDAVREFENTHLRHAETTFVEHFATEKEQAKKLERALEPYIDVYNTALRHLDQIRGNTSGNAINKRRAELAIIRGLNLLQFSGNDLRNSIDGLKRLIRAGRPLEEVKSYIQDKIGSLLGSESASLAFEGLVDALKDAVSDSLYTKGGELKDADTALGRVNTFLEVARFFSVEDRDPLQNENLGQLRELISIGESNVDMPSVKYALGLYGVMVDGIIVSVKEIGRAVLKRDAFMLESGARRTVEKGVNPVVDWNISVNSAFSNICLPEEDMASTGICVASDPGKLWAGTWTMNCPGCTNPSLRLMMLEGKDGDRVAGKYIWANTGKFRGTLDFAFISKDRKDLRLLYENNAGGSGYMGLQLSSDGQSYTGYWESKTGRGELHGQRR